MAFDDRASTGLRRSIRLPHAAAMVVGTIIGASIFVQPSEITARVPSLGGILLVWLFAGALTLVGALVCAELASAFPRTGGVYVFLREAYSPAMGFLWAWAMFWSMHSGIVAAIAMVFARYAAFFLPLGDAGVRGVAIAAIAAISAVNYVGVRQGSALQALFTAGKLVAIVVMVALAFMLGGARPVMEATSPSGAPSAADFLLAASAGLFAYGGWHMVTYSAEETVDPRRTIPRALLFGALIVTVCYIALNAAYLHVLPLEAVRSSTRVAADAAAALVGARGASVITGVVLFSAFGALAGVILAGPRVYFQMARDGLLFAWAGDVHPRWGTPHRAIVLQAAWSAVLVLTGTYRALFTRVIYTEWIFFALMAGGLFLLRRRADYSPSYRIWGYPLAPALFIAASAAVVLNHVVSDPAESAFGLALVLIGLPVYLLWTRRAAPAGRIAHATDRLP